MTNSENLIEQINNIDNQYQKIFLDYFKNDYIENLAKIYVNLWDANKITALQNFPCEVADEIKKRAEKYTLNDDDAILQAIRILGEAGFTEKNLENFKIALGKLTKAESDKIILNYEKTNPLLFFTICNIDSFLFEDIIFLDDRSIQKILREIDQQEIAKALKGASSEVQDKIFRNMSIRASNMLKEDMEFMGPVRLIDIEETQQKIVNIVERLEKNGEIIIPRNSIDEFVS